MTTSSQATSILVATDRPTSELVAYNQRPPRTLMEAWRRYRASVPLELPPATPRPRMVKLPPELLN